MKKFLKIIFLGLIVFFGGLVVLAAIHSSKLNSLAEEGGFESVAEYNKAQEENISTKVEYDAFLKRQAEMDAKAAENGGFLSVDEYKKARAVSMPTKELYDKYLVQQAEIKLAEEKQNAEKAKTESISAEK